MSGRGKRIWAPRLDFEAAYSETLNYIKRATEHNILQKQPAMLYHAYLVDGTYPVDGMQEISRYLRFGYDHQPQTDRGRNAVARLLVVANKAHFFLDNAAVVPHEPYIFVMPDLALGGQVRYGLIYPLESQGRLQTLVVADWDLAMASSHLAKIPPAQRFPAVLTDNPFQWLLISRWRALRKEAEKSPWFGSTTAFARRKLVQQARYHTDLATFPYGTPLTYPIELNADVMAAGGMWAPGIKRWFLPLGFDVDAAKAFLDAQLARSPQERHALRWWIAARAPKDGGSDDSD